jgi:hypothetical protein
VKPAKHGRDHCPGGEDPIPCGLPWARVHIAATSVTATLGTPANYAAPFESGYFPTMYQEGGYTLAADGAVVCPSLGVYAFDVRATFGDTEWQTSNFHLVTYPVYGANTLDATLGSEGIHPTSTEPVMSHDGTGLTNTHDRRKPEMQADGVHLQLFGALPLRIYPLYYSFTASNATLWSIFQITIVRLAYVEEPT